MTDRRLINLDSLISINDIFTLIKINIVYFKTAKDYNTVEALNIELSKLNLELFELTSKISTELEYLIKEEDDYDKD